MSSPATEPTVAAARESGKLRLLPLVALVVGSMFAPATLHYVMARRERDERLFTTAEAIIAVAVTAAALFAIYELITGHIKV